ncbi:MAG: alpha/beta hydrolase family protein [Thermoanaerobaculia bacterium]
MKRLLILFLMAVSAAAQTDISKQLESHGRRNDRQFEDTQRMVDDAIWYFRLGDVANIDKFEIASSKPRREKNATDKNAGNPIIFPVYVFSPKNLKGRAPMLVFAHGGVHGRLTTNYAHIFREALERGFVIISPEYRGSIGHGGDLYSQIDYGGAEIDDTHDARDWAVENLPFVDPGRVGIFGWSHGGFHTLMNIFQWPDDYKVAYAGVPVSDLVARMGYTGQSYRDLFEEFIGKQPEDNVLEYRRRSPVMHADKLRTPLLIHTTTNDEDVHVLEVEHMIAALKAAGKQFEYKIYQNAPGGHRFNRIDTKLAKDSRKEMWDFLARSLK